MRNLLSSQVITVSAEERLEDVSSKIKARSPSHCVVVEKPRGDFVGVVRLTDLGSRPTSRIFADLLSRIPAIRLKGKSDCVEIATVMEREKLEEAVVLSKSGRFLGLVTRESIVAWMRRQQSQLERDLAAKLEESRRVIRGLERELSGQGALLEEAFAHLDEFSYTISHDVRAPLRAVRGYAEALSDEHGEKLDKTANEYIARIIRASHRLDVLVLGILSYSQIARAKVVLEPTDLGALVAEVVSEKLRACPATSIRVEGSLLPVDGNKSLLLKCISHLLDNALKFVGGEPHPMVKISTERVGSRVRLSVEDNGTNVNRVSHDRIFEVFQGAPSANEDDGVAITLAIVRKAVEKMKGSLDAETLSPTSGRVWIELNAANTTLPLVADLKPPLEKKIARPSRASAGLGLKAVRLKNPV